VDQKGAEPFRMERFVEAGKEAGIVVREGSV
jgi:hypothetical protein